MVHASDLRHLSITGRYAYALACIENLCAAWDIDEPFVLEEVNEHWQATEIPLACHWFDEHRFPHEIEDFANKLESAQLSSDQVQSLYHAFEEMRMVICRSCYAAAGDEYSMESVLNVAGILVRWSIGLPDLVRFKHATWSGDFRDTGWGERLPRASFAS
jgi:hypothetical protein